MPRYVLGVNSYLHDSSAALMQDGRLLFAVEEERLSRIKKDTSFPHRSIHAALAHAGIRFHDLDAVAFGWNQPGVTPLRTAWSSLRGTLPRTPSLIGRSLSAAVRERYQEHGLKSLDWVHGRVPRDKVMHVDHHESHAWSAYACSGWEDALVLVADGRGAWQATSLYHARGEELRRVKVFRYPNSLGAFYEAFTDQLGFQRHNDEWKLMGLAAYGTPTHDLSSVLRVRDGGYEVDAPLLFGRTWGDMSAMERRFGARRNAEQLTEDDRNLAASAQRALEQAMFALVAEGVRLTGSRRLALAGGVAMNSKANGRILQSGLVDDVFVQPAATDDGTAIGAAIAAHRQLGLPVPRSRMTDAYLGPEFDSAEIERVLRTTKVRYYRVPDVERVTAGLIAAGHVVGWFQGRMEFGPRALGNRSILGDARRAEMKDRINESVKFREPWRPFAPSCLAEQAAEYFEGCSDAPFMILTFDVLPDQRTVIPAVTHADNTARVQTVTREANPRYWTLIREFAALTGVPVIVNTSFNLRGEPIVCSPQDALRTFYSSGLDFLVMGDTITAKDPNWSPLSAPK